MNIAKYAVHGAGLGLRRDFIHAAAEQPPAQVDFWEVAPENWIGIGGSQGRLFRSLTERFAFVCHGLSLSIGSPAPLDLDFLKRLKLFLDEHREIAQEFLDYLQNERETEPRDPPFLLELAHYEWVELAVSISEESADPGGADPNGDLMTGIPLVSPLAWNLSYRFPVHRIGPGFQPDAPPDEPTHLVVYRARTDEVQFMEINAVTQRLLQLLQENTSWTGIDTVKRIAEELCHPQPELVVDAGRQMLYDLRARNIVLGTRHSAT